MMTPQLSTLRLDGTPENEKFIPAIMCWMPSADQPFLTWLHGSEEAARAIIEERLRRQTSQAWLGRLSLALINSEPFGGFVGLSGAVQQRCFLADLVALLSGVDMERRVAFAKKIREAFSVFPPIPPDAYFLSRMGISPEYRGRGLGSYVVGSFLEQGRAEGFNHFQLHVFAENEPAVRLYRSSGFVVEREFLLGEGRFRYFRMVFEG